MKRLELSKLESISGGLECSSGFGASAAFIVGGLLLMASGPLGWGAALYVIGGVGGSVNGVFNSDCNNN